MPDDPNSGNGENTPPANPPAQPPTQPANPPAQPAQPDLSGLMTALAALPETIAKSVKEAVGTPAKPVKQETPTEQPKQEEKKIAAPAEPGKKKSFSDWWFGT